VEGILVWWIGEGHPDERVLDHVRLHLERGLGLPASLWRGDGRPVEAYDARRRQWSSSRILAWLARAAPDEVRVLGVTDMDLFIPILTFVFGEAQLGGRAAVVSTARLAEPGLDDPRIVLERLAKEAVHEMGHVLGLVHCRTPGCVMGRSAGVPDVDKKKGRLCPSCRGRVARAEAAEREAT
jgi:archaemetzincin